MAARSALIFLSIAVLSSVAAPAPAQRPFGPSSGFHARRELPGLRWLGFSTNGVWRGRARQVRATRARLLAGRQFSALNARVAPGASSSSVVSGTIVEPVILLKFQDTPADEIVADTLAYDSVLYAASPPNGRPFTVRTYYEQLTTLNGNPPLMTITGKSFGFVTLSQNEVHYTGGTSSTCLAKNPYHVSNCNGIFDDLNVFPVMQSGLREALALLDNGVDWTQFTSHGDTLDLAVFVQPAKDGACGGYPTSGSPATNGHIWSHRATLITPYPTHSTGPGGTLLKVVDYIIESGVGGANFGCDTTDVMPVGTVAHEHGHGFDLPDLYDTYGSSEGVGEYSLMGSGNYTSALSPSRMDAWSLSQLGWVNVVPLTLSGDQQFGGAPVSDTTFYARVRGPNPRGEYFLLENRQGLESDSAMIRIHGGGGLLVYHVDSTQMANHGFDRDNAVNAGPIKGLEIEQADGRGDLDAGRNRGDAGDPYPGTTGNTAISYNTNPAAVKNSDASFVGFAVDSIEQLVPNGAMRLRLQFGQPLSFAATVHGAITANPATTSGSFLAESSSVTLTAATDAGYVFAGWSGDTLTANTALALSMTHPYTLTANFGTPLAITTSDTLPGAVMGATYTDTLRASGGTGSFSWQAVGQLPPSLALSANGVLSGTVTRSGTFSVQARVTSVTLQQTHTFTLVATVPALGTPAVVAQILTGTSTLTPANLVYLDLIGNQDGQFDVGDFLAWVDSTGAPAASPPRTPVSTAARASTKGRSR